MVCLRKHSFVELFLKISVPSWSQLNFNLILHLTIETVLITYKKKRNNLIKAKKENRRQTYDYNL